MHKTISTLIAAAVLGSAPVLAENVTVEVTNLTNATYFTPLLVAAHSSEARMFQVGTAASTSLQAVAEGGDIDGLTTDLQALGANIIANPAGGLLAPGESAIAALDPTRRNRRLSLVGMLLPTNDGFVGLDSLVIPRHPGSYTFYLNGYDAGTEANDEIINGGGAPGVPGIPADPGGNGGSGATGVSSTEHNHRVHIHRGILGDTDAAGGMSDLDSRVHRWNNPVAKVVVTVKRGRHNH